MRITLVLAAAVAIAAALILIGISIFKSRQARVADQSPLWATASAPRLSDEEAAIIAAKYPTAQASASGLRYVVRSPGIGDAKPRPGQLLTVNYEGRLLRDGAKFDSSFDRREPFTFAVGMGKVIRGWDEALADMKRGERRTIIVPWWLGYGERGAPPRIPARASLIFEIELIDMN